MKRFILILMALLMLQCQAYAEYWTGNADVPKACFDDRPGCQVLQTVMLGSFAEFDPEDSLDVRVLSAALPRLVAVTEDDFVHFSEYHDVAEAVIREFFYIALANCLWANIIISPQVEDEDEQNAREVLHLFIAPSEEMDAAAQREIIRDNTTAQTIQIISENAEVPVGFVEYLMLKNVP